VQGDRLPADHGYRLYSALVAQVPALKDLDWQLGTITGIPDQRGWIQLGSRSKLWLRCPLPVVAMLQPLDNAVLHLSAGSSTAFLRLGSLSGQTVEPVPALTSRLIVIKQLAGTEVSEFNFGLSLGRQLESLGIGRLPELGQRGCIQVKGHRLIGYGCKFSELEPEQSLALQAHGLGGKRRMGCGVFRA